MTKRQDSKTLLQKLLDETVEKIIEKIHDLPPARGIGSSQILTGVFAVLGFAMFTKGIEKMMEDVNYPTLILVGILLMAFSGVLLQKISK